MYPQGTKKAPASPHTTRSAGAYREGHPDRMKARGWAAGETKNRGGRNKFKAHLNQQDWLPPAALTGCGGRGRGRGDSHIHFFYYIF